VDDLALDARCGELRQNHLPVVDRVFDTTRFQDRDDVVIGQEAPCRSTPHVYSVAVRDEQVRVDPFEYAPDAFYRKAVVTGQKDWRIAARIADLDQTRPAAKREYPQ
jgi:hypothetical protein